MGGATAQLERDRGGQTVLLLDDPGGELLASCLALRWKWDASCASPSHCRGLGKVHERGLIHKDINPSNILVNDSTSQVWLTGFGVLRACGANGRRPHRPSSSRHACLHGADRPADESLDRFPKHLYSLELRSTRC